ncbi:YkgJ family cysteine cluster protein [Sorangium sp. So ce269]
MRSLKILQRRDEVIRARMKGEIAALLGGERTVEALEGAATRAHAAMDEEAQRALARPGAPEAACSAGCSYCCHVNVDVTVPELLAIVAHVDRAWTPEARGSLLDRLAERAGRVVLLRDDERWEAKIPCALLDSGGRCSIYAARPLRCRALHASSVDPCRDAFRGCGSAGPATIPSLDRALDAAEEGYDQALREAGLAADVYRMELGLLIALDDPGAGAR